MSNAADSRMHLDGSEMECLVRRCQTGDGHAWSRVLGEVRRVALELGRWKYRLGAEDAEDVAQVVQIRVSQRLCQLRDAGAFPCWVRRLAHRAALDCLRARKPLLSL